LSGVWGLLVFFRRDGYGLLLAVLVGSNRLQLAKPLCSCRPTNVPFSKQKLDQLNQYLRLVGSTSTMTLMLASICAPILPIWRTWSMVATVSGLHSERAATTIDAFAQFFNLINEAVLWDTAEITDHALQAPPRNRCRRLWAQIADGACLVVIIADRLRDVIGLRYCWAFGTECGAAVAGGGEHFEGTAAIGLGTTAIRFTPAPHMQIFLQILDYVPLPYPTTCKE
jgi:hypothetical protein